MGGLVRIAVREPLGRIYCWNAWTGYISWFFNNSYFYDGNPQHIRDTHEHFVADWETDGKEPLAPGGYGLVLGDMQNKVILSSQGYTSVETLDIAGIINSRDGYVIGDDGLEEEHEIFYRLVDDKRISRLVNLGDKDKVISVEGMPPDDILKERDHLTPGGVSWYHVELITDPYTVENFSEDYHGLIAMRNRIKELGFMLSAKAEEEWKQFIKDLRLDEDEETELLLEE